MNFIARCFLSLFVRSLNENIETDVTMIKIENQSTTKTANLFRKMLMNFKFYTNFEINDTTGETLSINELMNKHYDKLFQLQKAIFKCFREELPIFPLQNIQSIDQREMLSDEFDKLNDEQLKSIAGLLQPPIQIDERELLMEVLISKHQKVQSHLDVSQLYKQIRSQICVGIFRL